MRRKNPKMCITIIRNFRVHIQAERVIICFLEGEIHVLSNRKDVMATEFFLSILHDEKYTCNEK